MSRDLRGALHDWAEHEEQRVDAQAPDPTAIASDLRHRVARRRAVRTGSSVAAAVVLVAGAALGVRALDRPEPAPPADPTPTWSPRPGPEPTPEPTDEPTEPTQPVATSTDVRDALPMPEGMLATTDATWQLVAYVAPAPTGDVLLDVSGLYLVPPTGPLYRVTDSPVLADRVVDWLPGTSTVVARPDELGSPAAEVTDLLTGEVHGSLGADVIAAFFAGDGSTDVWVVRPAEDGGRDDLVRVRADGSTVAVLSPPGSSVYGLGWLLNPSRTAMVDVGETPLRAWRADDQAALALSLPSADPGSCEATTWADDTHLVVRCAPDDEWWLVPVGLDGEVARQVAAPVPAEYLAGVWQLGDDLVAGTSATYAGPTDWWLLTEDAAVHLGTTEGCWIQVAGVRGAELVVSRCTTDAAGSEQHRIVAIDPVTGATRDLLTGVVTADRQAWTVLFPRTLRASPMFQWGDV